MDISNANAASHPEEINKEDGDNLEVDPTEDEVVSKTNFFHYQFLSNIVAMPDVVVAIAM